MIRRSAMLATQSSLRFSNASRVRLSSLFIPWVGMLEGQVDWLKEVSILVQGSVVEPCSLVARTRIT